MEMTYGSDFMESIVREGFSPFPIRYFARNVLNGVAFSTAIPLPPHCHENHQEVPPNQESDSGDESSDQPEEKMASSVEAARIKPTDATVSKDKKKQSKKAETDDQGRPTGKVDVDATSTPRYTFLTFQNLQPSMRCELRWDDGDKYVRRAMQPLTFSLLVVDGCLGLARCADTQFVW
jgi:hypothetical protein